MDRRHKRGLTGSLSEVNLSDSPRRDLLDVEMEDARQALRGYLEQHGEFPFRSVMQRLLSRLERNERIVNEAEQDLIRLAARG